MRVGTCVALSDELGLHSTVLCGRALAGDGTSRALGAGEAAEPDAALTEALAALPGAPGPQRTVASADVIRAGGNGVPAALRDSWLADGAVAAEMQAAALFAARPRGSASAVAALLVVSDGADGHGGRRGGARAGRVGRRRAGGEGARRRERRLGLEPEAAARRSEAMSSRRSSTSSRRFENERRRRSMRSTSEAEGMFSALIAERCADIAFSPAPSVVARTWLKRGFSSSAWVISPSASSPALERRSRRPGEIWSDSVKFAPSGIVATRAPYFKPSARTADLVPRRASPARPQTILHVPRPDTLRSARLLYGCVAGGTRARF